LKRSELEIEATENKQKIHRIMEIEITRKFLKEKLQKDTSTLHGFEKERDHIRDLFERTAAERESNSALLISPKQSGKTTVS
jgi:origin recognition complex subunit 4